jgi:DNA repair exonuclease SbcCD ATPase subunit
MESFVEHKNSAAVTSRQHEIRTAEICELQARADELRTELEELKSQLTIAHSLTTDVARMTERFAEGKRLSEQAAAIRGALASGASGALAELTSVEMCQTEEDKVYNAIQSLQAQLLENQRDETERAKQIAKLSSQIHDLTSSQAKVEGLSRAVTTAADALKRVEAKVKAAEASIASRTEGLHRTSERQAAARAALELVRRDTGKEVSTASDRYSKLDSVCSTHLRHGLSRICTNSLCAAACETNRLPQPIGAVGTGTRHFGGQNGRHGYLYYSCNP